MADEHPAFLRNRRELANGLFTISLDPPEAVRATFHTPGQYHRLTIEGVGESYFALASAPTATTFEYLVRGGSTVADAMVDGLAVALSAVAGPGFPLQQAVGHHLIMVATGTGIAPIRSVIQTILPQRARFGRVQLVYGARTEPELAFSSEFEAWASAGLELHLTLSSKHPGWKGEVGRVQQRLSPLEKTGAFAFLCGQAEMETEVAGLLVSQGVEAARIFLNH